MPFDDTLNLDLIVDDKDLDRLDQIASKREKELQRIQEKMQKQGGIFAKSSSKKTLPDLTALDQESKNAIAEDVLAPIFGGKTKNLPKGKTKEEVEAKRNRLRELLNSDLGAGKAQQAYSILENPVGYLTRQIPIIAGAFIIADLVKKVAEELTKRGGLLSTYFEDLLETRLDAFRDRLVQADIKAGFTQFINVQRIGFSNPRDAYNTFSLFNDNKAKLERDFSIRNTGGFE